MPTTRQQTEANRRLALLGDLINNAEFDYKAIKKRARYVKVPLKTLLNWYRQYQTDGLDGLKPDTDLSEKQLQLAKERYATITPEAAQERIDDDDIYRVAKRNGWTIRTARRWVGRYRGNGLWGLAPSKKSSPPPSSTDAPPRDLGTLSDNELQIVFQRYQMIAPLLTLPSTTNRHFSQQANELRQQGQKTSSSSLRTYVRRYKKWGLAGLADRERADKQGVHNISNRMVEIIQGIRLSQKDYPVRAVYEKAIKIAAKLDEVPPSEPQVRRIVNNIPPAVRLKADGRYNEFRSQYRLTYPINFGSCVVYQLDHTLIDVLAKDLRPEHLRNANGEIRLWLTSVTEARSRRFLAWFLGYDRPDRFTVGMALRQALLRGGIPDELWVDQGKEIISAYIWGLARDLGFELFVLEKHQPQQKARVERPFGMLNTRLWSRLEGYVASNTTDRNPTARAKYTPTELEQKLTEFIETVYHQEAHSSTKQTPIDYFAEHCFTEPVNPRTLDILLMEPRSRRVINKGIKYQNRVYWHSDLGSIVGQDVIIRSPTPYNAPPEIEVYYGNHWLCTAYDIQSETGKSVNRQHIANAQRAQKQAIKTTIHNARDALQKAEKEIAANSQADATEKIAGDAPQQKSRKAKSNKKRQTKTLPKKATLWERMGD